MKNDPVRRVRETGLIKQRTRLDEAVVNVATERLMMEGSGLVAAEENEGWM